MQPFPASMFDSRLPRRFWDKVVPCPISGCWLWTAYLVPSGYAQYRLNRKNEPAHRISYAALVGPIPRGLQLDHLCRVRCCVNPAHLEPVTARENTLRGTSMVAANVNRKCCPRGHAYDAANTYVNPSGARDCRACDRERKRIAYRRRITQSAANAAMRS